MGDCAATPSINRVPAVAASMTERVAMTVTTHGAVAGIGYRPLPVAAGSAVEGMGIALVADPPRLTQW